MTEARERIERQGACALCGGPFAAHRRIDGQMERVAAGEDIEWVADTYGVSVRDMVSEWITLMDLLHSKLDER